MQLKFLQAAPGGIDLLFLIQRVILERTESIVPLTALHPKQHLLLLQFCLMLTFLNTMQMWNGLVRRGLYRRELTFSLLTDNICDLHYDFGNVIITFLNLLSFLSSKYFLVY